MVNFGVPLFKVNTVLQNVFTERKDADRTVRTHNHLCVCWSINNTKHAFQNNK